MLELLEEWAAPDVTEVKRQEYEGKTNFMGIPINQLYSQTIEEEVEEEEIKPLTAEEIEQIRQDAYDEGFAQGKQDGFAKGEEEGLQQGHEQGLQQGHQEGYQTGLTQGQNEVNQLIMRWHDLSHQLYHPIEKVDRGVEKQLLNLVVALTESVIRQESKSNPDVLMSVLHEAVASLPFNTEFAEIHMHPDDIALLRDVYDDEAVAEQKWILKEEPGYQIGDVIVMTPNSLIDRTTKQRMRQTVDKFIAKTELDKEVDESLISTPEKTTPNYVQPDDPIPENVIMPEPSQQPVETQQAESELIQSEQEPEQAMPVDGQINEPQQ